MSDIRSNILFLRIIRKWHRYIGLVVAGLLIISCITGFLLAWKKRFEVLQPSTQTGSSKNLVEWMPIHQLADSATLALKTTLKEDFDHKIDRIDVRPSKGSAKVRFDGYWEVQVDGSTGKVFSVARRHADWIEQIHDGSIISNLFKEVSMTVLGLGVLVLTIMGYWLWSLPRKIRRKKRKKLKTKS